jgi:hypothetical protein
VNVAQLIERLQQGVASGEWTEETEVYYEDHEYAPRSINQLYQDMYRCNTVVMLDE